MANKRITDVDYLESLNSDESFFVNQNNTIKQINKNNIIFDVINGGTGANNVTDARENLGIGLVALEDIVPISKGGTGAIDASSALENLGASSVHHTHTADEIGAANASHEHDVSDIVTGVMPLEKGGTGADNGYDGLKNLFASGGAILSAYQYGDTLPDAGVVGRIFFKKVSS